MFKRKFRLPSPALVISMITLSLVLGGTAFAASTATHKDKKADIKLIKKLAPTLSVKHAKTADNATNAGHATSADSATNATNATNSTQLGGHAASFYAPAVLQSGQSESGTYSVATGTTSGGFMTQGFAFPTPLAASIDSAHVAWLNGTTTTNCPGDGHAAVGWLCVYAQAVTNATPNNGHAVNNHLGFGGADTYGFMLFFNATSSNAFTYGSWTVTAP